MAIGGDPRAAGILQTVGGLHSAPSAGCDYHRLPHHMPVEHQRHGATAAAHALLLAGYSVHLDPSLNTLAAPTATGRLPAATSTGAPEQLLALLDHLGFERQTLATAGPVYIWHEAPGNLDEAAQKQLATHAVPWLHKAGYMVHITDDVWDSAAYTDAATAMRNQSTPAPPPAVAAVRTTDPPPGTRRR